MIYIKKSNFRIVYDATPSHRTGFANCWSKVPAFGSAVLLFLAGACIGAYAQESAFLSGTSQCASLRAAIQDLTLRYSEQYPRGQEYLDALDRFEKQLPEIERACASGDETQRKQGEAQLNAFGLLQREALIANPLVSGRPILYVMRRQYRPDHHNTETMFQTGEINTASFEGGGALKTIDFARSGETKILVDTPKGVTRDPEVYFDGSKIIISMRNDIEDDYHIYEVNADGTGLRQLTSAKGVTDIDPLYLPDDSIVFASSREPKYCMCNRHIMCNMFRMEGDGANIHQISKNTLFDGHNALMPDGRILYNRWEYVDRNFGDAQGLWTVFPDGTGHAVYWGNNTQSPGAVFNARAIPGTEQVLCIFGSCHDRPWGALAIIDHRLGVDGASLGQRSPSVIRTWPADAIELAGEGDPARYNIDTFMKVNPKYEDPFPLDDKYFLCSRATGVGEIMGIYLVDIFGNEILLHAEDDTGAAMGCYDPMPIAPTPRPTVIPSRRDFNNNAGSFYVADVYSGTHMKGVARGSVKYLRVVESPEKRFWTNPGWSGQGQAAPAMNWHDFNNKRILGTTPVEEDGSVYFQAPSDKFLYFQLLDENGMMIQSMRSGAMIQSGETQGCTGCHEERRSSVPVSVGGKLRALRQEPKKLIGWYGPERVFNYMKEVQPVFDRNCMGCHDYGKEGAKALVLAADRDLVFNTSYNELWRKKFIAPIGAGPAQIQQAYSWGSHASKLVDILKKGHYDVKLDQESFERIVTWIDINAPYYPEYASAYPDNLVGRSPLDTARIARLTELTGVNFSVLMSFDQDRGPQITFERPELSPCLSDLKEKDKNAFEEAVAIIQAGGDMLKKQPRADMDGFIACPADQRREEKYIARQEIEARNREAIRTGKKVYDPK